MRIPKVSKDPGKNWKNNAIQFPRLIEELQGLGVFTPKVIKDLATSMDLTREEVTELLDRATTIWDDIKART